MSRDIEDTAAAAAAAASWDDLAATVLGCTACAELAASRTRVVPGVRPAGGADVLLVGEAPGAQEDAAGVPFVGRSGQLLDGLLADAGLPRERVAVANVLKCRPPANRKPRRAEVARCRPWLTRQLELADPAVVVALGGTAAEWFFGAGCADRDPAARAAAGRRPAGAGDLPPVGGDPLRPERRAPGRAARGPGAGGRPRRARATGVTAYARVAGDATPADAAACTR